MYPERLEKINRIKQDCHSKGPVKFLIDKLKNAPLWWHVLFIGVIFAFGRTFLVTSSKLATLLLLVIVLLLVGPVWFVPIPDTWPLPLQFCATILLAGFYYAPLFFVKRTQRYKQLSLANPVWIKLLLLYVIVNLLSAGFVLFTRR